MLKFLTKVSKFLIKVSFSLTKGAFQQFERRSSVTHTSPAGTALRNSDFVSSLRNFGGRSFCLIRRLKPSVNKNAVLAGLPRYK